MREESGEALSRDEAQFALSAESQAILEASAFAAALIDEAGAMRFVNARLARMLGRVTAELLNENIESFFSNDAASLPTQLPERRSDSERSRDDIHTSHAVFARVRDGDPIPVDIRAAPITLDGITYTLCTIVNRSREFAALEAWSTLRTRFDESQRTAQIGSWERDLQNDEVWWSDTLYEMLRISPQAQGNLLDQFLQRTVADDRRKISDRLRRGADGEPIEPLDIQVVLPDGTMRAMHSHAQTKSDESGTPIRIHGTLQDVTERKTLERRSREVEQRYRDAQRIARIGNWEWDVPSDTNWWSNELFSILEQDPSTCTASYDAFVECVHPEDRWMCVDSRKISEVRFAGKQTLELRLLTPKGTVKHTEMIIETQLDETGKVAKAVGTLHDITERFELERQLRESEARYSSTVELAALGIAHVDLRGTFTWANKHMLDMLGYTLEEIQELTIADVSHPEDVNTSDEGRAKLHRGEIPSLKLEKRYIRKDGEVVWVRLTSAVNCDENGTPLHDITIVEDISNRKAAEQRVQYLATHDEMTGLHNRAMFSELLAHAIESARRRSRSCAVLFIDLDRFKIINDSLGHGAGDQLIIAMANRLRDCVRKSDVMARLGGDEFVVLLEELESDHAAEDVARKVLSATLVPVQIQNQECRVTASIGIAFFPKDAQDAATLMKHADMAMYRAKEEGKNNFQVYCADESPMSVTRLALETQLAKALENDEFTVMYQPKVDIRTGRVNGVEALLRWWNPELGTVSPAQFIPVAEDTGLIVPIGKWVLRKACEQNVAWQKSGLPPLSMAVNLSPRQFADAALLQDITEVLAETGMAPETLELEITESMIMHNVDRAARVLDSIKKLGIRLAIDDFGTGYSSLSQLKRFPIDTLKIDRSFVRDIPDNCEDKAITEAIISLGKTLGVSVIAEGVESPSQLSFLEERACDSMQGFLFSRPCSPEALASVLRDNLLGGGR